MTWLVAKMRWIMLVSGALTCSMVYAAIAPQASMRSTFGEGADGPAAELVVRNWGALIALVGVMLIYGAFSPMSRTIVLTIAGLSKMTFIGLVLSHGARYLGHQAGVAVVVDSLMVILFASHVVAARRTRPAGDSIR